MFLLVLPLHDNGNRDNAEYNLFLYPRCQAHENCQGNTSDLLSLRNIFNQGDSLYQKYAPAHQEIGTEIPGREKVLGPFLVIKPKDQQTETASYDPISITDDHFLLAFGY